jgi:hydroxyacylglutathione hydrolase
VHDLFLYRTLFGIEKNIQYLLIKNQETILVDPLDGEGIVRFLKEKNLTPRGVLLTHPHYDHIAGIPTILSSYPDLPIYLHHQIDFPDLLSRLDPHFSPKRSVSLVPLREGEIIPFGERNIAVYEAPGHHPHHLLFQVDEYLFVGDTLFSMGCGNTRFGGNGTDLFHSLWNKILLFPGNWIPLFGHDYREKNLLFAQKVDPKNPYLPKMQESLKEDLPPLYPLEWEKKVNPFLRVDQEEIFQFLKEAGFSGKGNILRDRFLFLRQLRDNF